MGSELRVVSGTERKVIDASASSTQTVSEEELTRAEDELREEARQLVKEIEHKYWDLGRVLYDVFDGVPGGYRALMQGDGSRQTRQELFRKWGYANFEEYCEKEVGLRKRTAENIRYAYYWFAIQQEMPKEVVDRLISLGRSKVYLLAGFATKDNVLLWIEKAVDFTHEQLKKSIKQSKAVLAGESTEFGEDAQAPSKGEGDAPVDDGSKKLPKPEELHTLQTSLYDSQWATWNDAFERAQGISKSPKVGHNLELICQDFLSNNDFSNSSVEDRAIFIRKTEKRLGLLLIAIDPATGSPVHNTDLLWRLVTEMKNSEKDGAEE